MKSRDGGNAYFRRNSGLRTHSCSSDRTPYSFERAFQTMSEIASRSAKETGVPVA